MRDAERKKILTKALPLLKKRYRKEMHTSLDFDTPWQLLVATMLSAQAQDSQVNKVTPILFKKYPKVENYARLSAEDLYPYTKTIGLYKGKSKNIVETAKLIMQNFDGEVPKTIEQLVTLHGVGRKTANVVLHNAYGISKGIAIDTHCITTLNRILLLKTDNAQKIEAELMEILPKSEWQHITHLLIALGRDVCTAKTKYCQSCVLNKICPSSDVK